MGLGTEAVRSKTRYSVRVHFRITLFNSEHSLVLLALAASSRWAEIPPPDQQEMKRAAMNSTLWRAILNWPLSCIQGFDSLPLQESTQEGNDQILSS